MPEQTVGEVDLSTPTSIHVIGVGGAGMSALALVFARMGHSVSGSDLRESPVLAKLRRAGVTVSIGHDRDHLGDARVVTASPAVSELNPELSGARDRGITVVKRSEMMGAISRLRRTVAVAGTHGKTTTSSMLSLILLEAGVEPSFLIGAEVSGLGANAVWDRGELLVIEADESYGSFSALEPSLSILTNVEADHLDHYGTIEGLEAAFEALLRRSSEATAVMADDVGASRVGAAVGALRVGLVTDESSSSGRHLDARISDVQGNRTSSRFHLGLPGGGEVSLLIGAPGLHNVRNASMAAVGASLAGVTNEAIVAGLQRFAGVPRRFEFRGELDGISFVDDYAHLPAEVLATLEAASSGGFERIVAVFQPHRFTRTQAVAANFVRAFDRAAHVVITDIYSAGEAPIPGVSGHLVADAVTAGDGSPEVTYVADRLEVASVVSGLLREGDLCLTMGAGDLTTLPDEILDLRRR